MSMVTDTAFFTQIISHNIVNFESRSARLPIYFTTRNSRVQIEIDMKSNESSDGSSEDFVASSSEPILFSQSEQSDVIREYGNVIYKLALMMTTAVSG